MSLIGIVDERKNPFKAQNNRILDVSKPVKANKGQLRSIKNVKTSHYEYEVSRSKLEH